MEKLGETLKKAREKKGLSLRQVEDKTGISNAHVSQIESGRIGKPEMAILWHLADLYGLDFSRLLRRAGYSDEPESSGRQRQRMSVAMRAMGELTPKDQRDVIQYMSKLRAKRKVD